MLLTSQPLGEMETQASVEATDSTEALRQILISEQNREVAYNEAREIGESLIEFFQALAEEECNEPEA